MPMMTLFDKQIQLRMGQANVKRWVDDILPLLTDDDPLGVDDFATPPPPARRGARRLRDLPEEGGRRRQVRHQPVAVVAEEHPELAVAGREDECSDRAGQTGTEAPPAARADRGRTPDPGCSHDAHRMSRHRRTGF